MMLQQHLNQDFQSWSLSLWNVLSSSLILFLAITHWGLMIKTILTILPSASVCSSNLIKPWNDISQFVVLTFQLTSAGDQCYCRVVLVSHLCPGGDRKHTLPSLRALTDTWAELTIHVSDHLAPDAGPHLTSSHLVHTWGQIDAKKRDSWQMHSFLFQLINLSGKM